MKQIVSLLIHADSTCFITVLLLFHHCFTSGNEPLVLCFRIISSERDADLKSWRLGIMDVGFIISVKSWLAYAAEWCGNTRRGNVRFGEFRGTKMHGTETWLTDRMVAVTWWSNSCIWLCTIHKIIYCIYSQWTSCHLATITVLKF